MAPIPDQAQDLMFEVVGPGREAHEHDYVETRRDSSRFGAREYILVDRPARRVTVFTRGICGYRRGVLQPGAIRQTPLLPGLAILPVEAF